MGNFVVPRKIVRLDAICGIGVCAAPIRDTQLSTPGAVTVHLHVVTRSGTFFTPNDLDRMCLNPHDLGEFFTLCSRRVTALANAYLPPRSTLTAVVQDQEVPYVDPDGFVRVSFFLSGHAPV